MPTFAPTDNSDTFAITGDGARLLGFWLALLDESRYWLRPAATLEGAATELLDAGHSTLSHLETSILLLAGTADLPL